MRKPEEVFIAKSFCLGNLGYENPERLVFLNKQISQKKLLLKL